MVLVARLYSMEPPAVRTRAEDNPTLLVSWWCTIFALVIILFRLAGRIIRTERLFREDKIMALAIIPLMVRMGLVHVILLFGTNNIQTMGLSPESIERRKIGSGLVLASRICYAAVLWIEKFTITEFFKRVTGTFWNRSYERGIRFLRWFLVITFAAVVISTVTECQPFEQYWQVVPDPGPQCRQGYAQLLTMGTANVLTDMLLVIFPIPIILRSAMKAARKFELIMLFALSIIPIAVTLIRIPAIIDHQGRQQSRSLWASIELLFATAVTNALVLGSFVRDRGPKKMRFKFGSASDSLSRPSTRRTLGRMDPGWGSDEDLVRGMGLTLDPELRGEDMVQKPRPAPMAPPGRSCKEKPQIVDLTGTKWQFPSDPNTTIDLDTAVPDADRSPGGGSISTSRKVSFFDVGGLLEQGIPPASASTPRTPEKRNSLQPHDCSTDRRSLSSRQTSHQPALHDVGGLLAPNSPSVTRSPSRQMQSRPLSPSSPYYRPLSPARVSPSSHGLALRSSISPPPQARHGPGESDLTLARSTTPASFVDVSGLLRSKSPTADPSGLPDSTSQWVTRPPPTYRSHRHPAHERPMFQDVGGLLNEVNTESRSPNRESTPSALSLDPDERAVSPLTTLDSNHRFVYEVPAPSNPR